VVLDLFIESGLVIPIDIGRKFARRKVDPPKLYLFYTGLSLVLQEGTNVGTLAEDLVLIHPDRKNEVRYLRGPFG